MNPFKTRGIVATQPKYNLVRFLNFFRDINDPEHPLTLEQLDVVKLEDVHVDDQHNKVNIVFTPTIPHCSMATLIGLSIRVKLLRSLPARFKVSSNIMLFITQAIK